MLLLFMKTQGIQSWILSVRRRFCSNKTMATKELAALAIARFDLPGDPGFPRELNNLYAKPKTPTEAEQMRSYLTQLRQEMGVRLIDKVFLSDTSPPSKIVYRSFVCHATKATKIQDI
ncbi:unnamed protein product [Protopolystoma xenopodis]|uniref:Uncharacterized protein n=1 Tax=Protopolystoma xenopodis TaxID=117903 RepID=A0A3S5BYC1_9PLAT|nr:unnamed protein product [Protopolystoma xenopodis]